MAQSLSHSKIELFARCERQYQLERVERVERAPSEALIIGDAVHQAIEYDGREYIKHGGRIALPELEAVYVSALVERWRKDDPRRLLEPALDDMEARGLALIGRYVADVQAIYKPMAVEQTLTRELAPGVEFVGRIDAMQRTREGRPVILDVKTAGKPWPDGAEHGKPQASAYLWLGEQQWPALPPVRVTFVVLSPAGADFRATTRTVGQLDEWAGIAASYGRAIETAAASGVYRPTTGPLCGWCPVLGHCEHGRRWLAEHGRTPAVPVIEPKGAAR